MTLRLLMLTLYLPIYCLFFPSNMPNKCSVANCSSNYDGHHYIPIFEMLNNWSNDVKEEWRTFLHRDNAGELARYLFVPNILVMLMFYYMLIFLSQMVQ